MTRLKRILYRFSHFPPRAAYALGLGPLLGKMVLLLTTRGRKSGKPRVTPLQYERIDNTIYVASAMGAKADWIRNIQADPHVQVRVGSQHINGEMEIITNREIIADFMEVRLARHPHMIRLILRMDGLKGKINRDALLRYGGSIVIGRLKELSRPVEL